MNDTEDRATPPDTDPTNGGDATPTSGENAAPAPSAAVAELEAQLRDSREQMLRARAEVENVLKRAERDKRDLAAYAIAGFARDLLAVSDNLRRALEALPEDARAAGHTRAFVEGIEMTERELLAAFERHGIRKLEPKGEKFDHNLHQAMAEVDAADSPAGTVVDVYQPGYVLKERLLRPAMVTVARAAPSGKPAESVDTEA